MNRTPTQRSDWFSSYLPVRDPRVVMPRPMKGKETMEYQDEELEGVFARVFPQNAREIFLLQHLEPRRQKWAPAATHGNGIIVTMDAINGNFA